MLIHYQLKIFKHYRLCLWTTRTVIEPRSGERVLPSEEIRHRFQEQDQVSQIRKRVLKRDQTNLTEKNRGISTVGNHNKNVGFLG